MNLEAGVRSDSISGRQSFVINGAPPQQGFNFMVDGTDGTGVETGEVGGGWTSPYQSTYTLSLDSIAEFVVHSNSYSAKYGRALGGVVEAVTKSGENTPHGNVFYYYPQRHLQRQHHSSKRSRLISARTEVQSIRREYRAAPYSGTACFFGWALKASTGEPE